MSRLKKSLYNAKIREIDEFLYNVASREVDEFFEREFAVPDVHRLYYISSGEVEIAGLLPVHEDVVEKKRKWKFRFRR